MQAEQLWKTTLDPNARTLLQVKVTHADEAEEVFSTLMGDLVEQRRDSSRRTRSTSRIWTFRSVLIGGALGETSPGAVSSCALSQFLI